MASLCPTERSFDPSSAGFADTFSRKGRRNTLDLFGRHPGEPDLGRELAGGIALGHGRHRQGLDLARPARRAELLEALLADRAHRVHGRLQVLARVEL